jgi:uncharacterized protein HemY
MGATLHQLGFLAIQREDFTHAQKWLEESLSMKHQVGDPESTALTQALLAQLLIHNGERETGIAWITDSLTTLRRLNSPWADEVQETLESFITRME